MPCCGSATRPARRPGAERSAHRTRRCGVCTTVAILALLVTGPPAAAQQFGQWSWDATLGAKQVGRQSGLVAEPVSSRDETSLALGLGVRGFIVHPALARFRVGVDVALSKFDGTRSRDNRIWGFDANLDGLPRGAYPFSVYARRRAFSYEDLQEEDPLNLLGVPETSTGFGGRLRFRRGLLNGTLLGFDQQGVSYADADSRSTRDQRAFVDWSRSTSSFQHHFRLRRRAQEFRVADFGTRDLTLNYDQRGHINPAWRWDMFVIGLHRDLDSPTRAASRFDNLRTRQLFVHTLSGQDRLELSYNGGLVRATGSPGGHSHSLVSRYRWWVRPGWELTPFVSYAFQVRDDLTVQAPQAGLFTSWSGRSGPLDTLLSGGLGYTRFRRSVAALSGEDSALTMEAAGTLGHGRDEGLRVELEASWGRNQLRLIGEAIPELPDLGLALTGLGTEDSARGRLTLRRRWGSFFLSAYSEASRRRASRSFAGQHFTFDRHTHTLQIMASRLTLTGNLGRARVEETDRQSIDNWSVSASWRPFRLLSLGAWYRSDSRRLALAPDIDGERFEVRADMWVGAFLLSGQVFETTQSSLEIPDRTHRGFTVTLSRRFGGWLPFRTGPSPNGVIR